MRVRVINDVHLFGVNPSHQLADVRAAIASCPRGCMLASLGDVVDLKNAPKEMVPEALAAGEALRKSVLEVGGVFTRGNHELNLLEGPDAVTVSDVYFTHGDREFWGEARAAAFRREHPGSGWARRTRARLIDALRHTTERGINERFRRHVRALTGVRAVVAGHRHPTVRLEGAIDGVRYLVLPRGIHDLDV